MGNQDISKDYSEKLAEHILDNYITLAILKTFAEKEGCTVMEALDGRLRERLLEKVSARTGSDNWAAFAELPDELPAEVQDNEDFIRHVAFDIGVKGWELGYLAGFADRNALG